MPDRTVGLLPEDLLEKFRARAPTYDRENKFFQEDFEDLKTAGYLRMTVPQELGGLGFSLADVSRVTRRLAMYAPATALGMNMHHYWVGLAADLWRQGDKSCEWILHEAAAGEVFAAGHAETGNDLPLLLSTTKGRARQRRLHVHGEEVIRQLVTRLDPPRPARDGRERPEGAQDRPRVPATRDARHHNQGILGCPGHACHEER